MISITSALIKYSSGEARDAAEDKEDDKGEKEGDKNILL